MRGTVVKMRLLAGLMAGLLTAGNAAAQDVPPQPASKTIGSRYTFSWPVGPDAPAPRGGTTRGVPVEPDGQPSAEWKALQESGIGAQERDRRAILAMAGSYRVTFDFIEVASFAGNGARAQPYQSWGTERVFVDRNEPGHVSLVHVLEMRVLDKEDRPSEPVVTRHWRQDWRYEPEAVVEYQSASRWTLRKLAAAERRGRWSQTVHQIEDSPRYGALGRWEHNGSFSTWISGETARPLPGREGRVRKDYDLLRGTNRHTVLPTGWLQEENNLKVASGAPARMIAREYGVARYERLKNVEFSAAQEQYSSTRAFWHEVLDEWAALWRRHDSIVLRTNSDQTDASASLTDLAGQYAAGRLKDAEVSARIRASLHAQMASNEITTGRH